MIKKIKIYLIVFFILSLAACGEGGNSLDCDVHRQYVDKWIPIFQDNGKLFIGDKYYRFEQKIPTSDDDVEEWLDGYIETSLTYAESKTLESKTLGAMRIYAKLYRGYTGKEFDFTEWDDQEEFISEVKKLLTKEFKSMPKERGVFFDTKKNIYNGWIEENVKLTLVKNEIIMTWTDDDEEAERNYITIHLPGSKLVNAQKDAGKKFDYIMHKGKPDLFFTKKGLGFNKSGDRRTYITCDPLKVKKSSTEKPKKTTPEKTKKGPPKETKTSPETNNNKFIR